MFKIILTKNIKIRKWELEFAIQIIIGRADFRWNWNRKSRIEKVKWRYSIRTWIIILRNRIFEGVFWKIRNSIKIEVVKNVKQNSWNGK